jgi:hypothetical protein
MDGWMDGGLDDWILDGYWMDIGWIKYNVNFFLD